MPPDRWISPCPRGDIRDPHHHDASSAQTRTASATCHMPRATCPMSRVPYPARWAVIAIPFTNAPRMGNIRAVPYSTSGPRCADASPDNSWEIECEPAIVLREISSFPGSQFRSRLRSPESAHMYPIGEDIADLAKRTPELGEIEHVPLCLRRPRKRLRSLKEYSTILQLTSSPLDGGEDSGASLPARAVLARLPPDSRLPRLNTVHGTCSMGEPARA
jgi:hypothetical protein